MAELTCPDDGHSLTIPMVRLRQMNALVDMLADVKYALRRFNKSPGFTATAVVTLALGIGATAAIFTLIQEVMLRSLAVANPEQLWRIGDAVTCYYSTPNWRRSLRTS